MEHECFVASTLRDKARRSTRVLSRGSSSYGEAAAWASLDYDADAGTELHGRVTILGLVGLGVPLA